MTLRRLLPDSLLFWLAAILAAGILLSQAASALLHDIERGETLTRLEDRRIAEQVAAIALFLGHSAPMLRPGIARSLSAAAMEVRVLEAPDAGANAAPGGGDTRLAALGRAIAAAGASSAPAVWVEALPADAAARQRRLMPVAVFLPLPEGQWLQFRFYLSRPAPFADPRWLALTAASLGGILLLCFLAVARVLRPLERLSAAAERLGRGGQHQSLPENGIGAVGRAARSFNRMQERITRLVEDRLGMIAAISHDLKTPITRMKLRAELLEDEELRARMLHDLDEMAAMIRSTLAFARAENNPEPREAVALDALLREIAEESPPVELAFSDPQERGFVIAGQRLALKRALANLVENALVYGGGAEVAVTRRPEEVEIRILDTGPGIPEAERERVFRPFYRLESSRNRDSGGSGLGLAIARSALLAHGGDIALANRPEGGLEVTLRLPA